MLEVDPGDNINVVVQIDRGRPSEGDSQESIGGIADWQTTKRLQVTANSLLEVQDLGEVNTGDPRILADFVIWGLQTFPAQQHALILWDHGSVLNGFGQDETNDDDDDDDALTLPEVRSALDDALAAQEVGEFALIGFDACLMGSLEVAYELSHLGEVLVASSELEPGHGWDYSAILQHLRTSPASGAQEVALNIADSFQAHAIQIAAEYRASGWDYNDERQITLSSIDLGVVEDLIGALDLLAVGMTEALVAESPDIGETWLGIAEAVYGSDDYGAEPGGQGETVDLGQVLEALRVRFPQFSEEIASAESLLRDAVLYKVSGVNRENASGLAVHFPIGESVSTISTEQYVEFEIGYGSLWADLVLAHQSFGDEQPPEFATGTTFLGTDDFGNLILAAENVHSDVAEIYAYVVRDDVILGMLSAEPDEDGIVGLGWDDRWFVLGSGDDWVYTPFWTYENLDATTTLAEIDIFFQPQGADAAFDAVLMVEYDWLNDEGEILGVWGGVDEGFAQREIRPIAPGDSIQVLFLDVEDLSFVDGDILTVGPDGLSATQVLLPPGDYEVGFLAFDYAGNDADAGALIITVE